MPYTSNKRDRLIFDLVSVSTREKNNKGGTKKQALNGGSHTSRGVCIVRYDASSLIQYELSASCQNSNTHQKTTYYWKKEMVLCRLMSCAHVFFFRSTENGNWVYSKVSVSLHWMQLCHPSSISLALFTQPFAEQMLKLFHNDMRT